MKAKKFNALVAYAKMLMVLFFLSATAISCNDDDDNDDPQPTQTIVGLAQGNSNLSSLVTALTKFPDLVSALNGNGTFTVFAPTNQAFQGLLAAIGQTSLDDIPESVLREVLEYHVISSAALASTDLSNGDVETFQGEDITVSISPGVRLNGTVNVTSANIEATNGVVHVVDAVLVPPSITPIVGTIVAPAYFNKDFTTLIAAVLAADESILTLLLSDGPSDNGLTLFAPTNEAFAAAGITSLPDEATLNAVLAYHVIDGTVMSGDLPEGSAAIESLGGEFYLSNNASGVFINANSEVVAVDIDGSNGVVHVIDRVIIPPSETITDIAVNLSTSSAPEFTQLVAALVRTSGQAEDLLAAVSDEDANLTVFAPTDEAFEALYDVLGVAGVNEIPLGTLTAVLKHHVVGARVFSTDLTDGSVGTLNGNVTIDASEGTITDGSGGEANLSANAALLNVLATNGVIHTIDKVLLPE